MALLAALSPEYEIAFVVAALALLVGAFLALFVCVLASLFVAGGLYWGSNWCGRHIATLWRERHKRQPDPYASFLQDCRARWGGLIGAHRRH